jgi:hypothetical protein
MTYKVFGVLKRPDGMTFEQFKKWWLEVHVGIVRSLGEKRVFCGVSEEVATTAWSSNLPSVTVRRCEICGAVAS